MIGNILAERYAGDDMKAVWSAEGRILIERDFWLAVLKAQRDLGIPVPERVLDAYERVKHEVDPESILRRERVTRHDVKARIEEFCALAGEEHIHKGMTSRDLTENVEQLQVWRSLRLVQTRAAAAVGAFACRAEEFRDLVLAARTHNVVAQPTTLGKRLAMFGEELLRACRTWDDLAASYPARGLKGAVGTQLDQLTLFGGEAGKVAALERKILEYLGLPSVLNAVGQVYPRSLDFEVVSGLLRLASAPSSFARTLRLMAGHELAGEGFAPGQVGSSAMPHKMNSRTCERINGFHTLLRGYLAMAADLAGGQWNEGDVSCSVVRRVMLPDSFFAIDGLFAATLTVLDQMEASPALIERENRRVMPFLAATTLLMEAVKAGAGREEAHEAIREKALAVARDLRAGSVEENDLAARLADDARLRLPRGEIDRIISETASLTGLAGEQTDAFVAAAEAWLDGHPEGRAYRPGAIL